MHQLQQQIVPTSPIMQQVAETPAIVNGNGPNPLLDICTTLVTNTNINVTYLNGAINANKQFESDKFHQGFIAVLKVSEHDNYVLTSGL